MRAVVLGGLRADLEAARDFLRGEAFDDEVEHLALARGQAAIGIVERRARLLQLLRLQQHPQRLLLNNSQPRSLKLIYPKAHLPVAGFLLN